MSKFKVGDKLKFKNEKQQYTIQACDERYLICTKPFNIKKTVLYTIVDLKNKIRAPENLIFCMGFETKELCEEALSRLQKGESELSYRNRVTLELENTIILPCLYCGQEHAVKEDSYEGQGIFNVFCSDKPCEDYYAQTL